MGTRVRACADGGDRRRLLLAGCGEEDFENEARAPVREALTGVIQDDKVTVSPSKIGAGPVEITISNQTDQTTRSRSRASRSWSARARWPGDTATIQKTLEPGSYEVRAGSEKAVRRRSGRRCSAIGKERENSNNDLLLP